MESFSNSGSISLQLGREQVGEESMRSKFWCNNPPKVSLEAHPLDLPSASMTFMSEPVSTKTECFREKTESHFVLNLEGLETVKVWFPSTLTFTGEPVFLTDRKRCNVLADHSSASQSLCVGVLLGRDGATNLHSLLSRWGCWTLR